MNEGWKDHKAENEDFPPDVCCCAFGALLLRGGGLVSDVLLSVSVKAHRERMDHLAGRGSFPHAPVSSDLCWSHFYPKDICSLMHSLLFFYPLLASYCPFALSLFHFVPHFFAVVYVLSLLPQQHLHFFLLSISFKTPFPSEFIIFSVQVIYSEVKTRISFSF